MNTVYLILFNWVVPAFYLMIVLLLCWRIRKLQRLCLEVYVGVIAHLPTVTEEDDRQWANLADQLLAAGEGRKFDEWSIVPFHLSSADSQERKSA